MNIDFLTKMVPSTQVKDRLALLSKLMGNKSSL